SGVPPGEQTWQDPDGSGQVGHAMEGGTLTLRPCGATNDACEIGGALGASAARWRVPMVSIGDLSFTGSRVSVLLAILEVGDLPSPGGKNATTRFSGNRGGSRIGGVKGACWSPRAGKREGQLAPHSQTPPGEDRRGSFHHRLGRNGSDGYGAG